MTGQRRRKHLRFATLAAVAAAPACGDPAPPENRAPVAVGEFPPVVLLIGEQFADDVAKYFSDPDDDPLSFSVRSSNVTAATVELGDGDTVTVTAQGEGTATITITAGDPGGLTAQQEIGVTAEFPNRAPEVIDTLPLHDLFIVMEDTASDPDTLSRVVLDASTLFRDPDRDTLAYTASTEHDSVARVESVVGSVITTIPVMAAGPGLWDSTTLTVTATDPEGLSATQEAQVRVAREDYEPWSAVEITDGGGLVLRGNNQPITGCVPIDERPFDDDTVYTVHRSEWQVRRGTGWVRVLGTYRELEICSWDQLSSAPAGVYRLAGEVTTWPADTAETDPGDTVRALRASENVIEISDAGASPRAGLADAGTGAEPGTGPARQGRGTAPSRGSRSLPVRVPCNRPSGRRAPGR